MLSKSRSPTGSLNDFMADCRGERAGNRRAFPMIGPEEAEVECQPGTKGSEPFGSAGNARGCQLVDEGNPGAAESKLERHRGPEHLDAPAWRDFLLVEQCVECDLRLVVI